MMAIRQRWSDWTASSARYPRLLQALVSLILLATPFSAIGIEQGGMLAYSEQSLWLLVALIGGYLFAFWLVPVRCLPRWLQLLYLIGQCGLTAAAWAVQPAPMLDYVYLTIVLQAIYLFRAWLWIPFASGVWLVWSGTLMIASTNLLEWLKSNLVFAFPVTCVLIAAILYARQNRRYEQVQQVLQQMQHQYDALVLHLRDVQQRAALEERHRLAQTITSDVNAALVQTEQSVSAAIYHAQTNLARLQVPIAQTRLAASAAVERLRNAIITLRGSDDDVPLPPAPNDATITLPSADPLLSSVTARVLSWVLPSVFVTLALVLLLLQQPLSLGLLLYFVLFCVVLLLTYGLTQRMRHPVWMQVGLAVQVLAVLALTMLTQTLPLLLGLLLVIWQIALRFSPGQIIAFLAGMQTATGMVVLHVLPAPPEFGTNLLVFGVACAVLAGLLWMARAQLNRRHQDEQHLVHLTRLTDELEQQAGQLRALAVAAERTRLAREFHDDLGSQLVLINVQLQVAEELIEEEPGAALEQLVATREQLRTAWRSVLAAADATLTIDGPSLEPALRELIAQCRPLTSARIGLHIAGMLQTLHPPVACTIYRAAQEGLTNACKYARAQHIVIIVAQDSTQVTVSVCDDGYELPAARADEPSDDGAPLLGIQGGFGLTGLRERAALLGGSLNAGPLPNQGFGLHLTIPLTIPLPEGTP